MLDFLNPLVWLSSFLAWLEHVMGESIAIAQEHPKIEKFIYLALLLCALIITFNLLN